MIVCFWLDILIFISVFFGNKFNLTCDFLVSFQLDLIAVLHEWSWILLFIYLFLGGVLPSICNYMATVKKFGNSATIPLESPLIK